MSDVIGPVAFRNGDEHPFLGKEMHEQREFSEETAHVIDQEMQRFLNLAAQRSTEILQQNREKLDKVAKGLTEQEMVTYEQLNDMIGPPVERTLHATKLEG